MAEEGAVQVWRQAGKDRLKKCQEGGEADDRKGRGEIRPR